MCELNLPVTTASVAEHYRGLVDGLVIDESDAAEAATLDLPVLATGTVMHTVEDKERLARAVLDFAHSLKAGDAP
jgi:LPPG:FO 2-phospho-L-lactate transferase